MIQVNFYPVELLRSLYEALTTENLILQLLELTVSMIATGNFFHFLKSYNHRRNPEVILQHE